MMKTAYIKPEVRTKKFKPACICESVGVSDTETQIQLSKETEIWFEE